MKQIQLHKGVEGVIILNGEGESLQHHYLTELSMKSRFVSGKVEKTTFDSAEVTELTKFIGPLCYDARNAVRNIDPSDDLTFLRVRTKLREIIVSSDHEYTIIVMQSHSGH